MEKQNPRTVKADQKTFMPALAAAIRRRRKEMGWTQEDLGKAAGCGLAYLYLLENGKTSVRLDKLLDVMSILGLQFTLENGCAGIEVPEACEKPVAAPQMVSPLQTPQFYRPVTRSQSFDFID